MTDYIQTLEKTDYPEKVEFLSEDYFNLIDKLQTEIDSSNENSLLDYKFGQLSDEERETLLFNRYYLNKSTEQLDDSNETHSYYTKLIKDTDNILVLFNLPLVKNRAKDIIRNRQLSPNIYPELLIPGIEGLHLAIRYFDPNKECKLSTLAFPTISQKINDYIDTERETIRLPYPQRERLKALRQARREFTNSHHREPTYTELVEYYEKKEGRIRRKDYLLRAIESKRQIYLDSPIKSKDPTLILPNTN
jgi:DNA-directed RNA polymerase specialized sigma subunit